MAQASRPTPDNGYVLTTDEYEGLVLGYAQDGINGSPADTSVVYADSTGRQVKIRAAKRANVRGRLWKSDPSTDEIVSALPANVSGNPRIDRLVLRLNRATGNVASAYIQGTPAASPTAPALTQSTSLTSGSWDFPLARWTVANGYTTIAAGDVTLEGWYITPDGQILCTTTSLPQGLAVHNGMVAYTTNTGGEWRYRSNKWLIDVPQVIITTADTAYTSQTTLQNDPTLTFPVDVNSSYEFEFDVGWIGAAGIQYKFAITFPAGARIDYTRITKDNSAAPLLDYLQNAASGAVTNCQSNVAAALGQARVRGLLVVGPTNAGNVTWQAAQVTSNAASSWTLRGSTLRYRQFA